MDKYILGDIVWCYQNRTPLETFCGDNLISKNFNKLSLVKTLFNQNTGLNVLEHCKPPSYIFSWGCFEIDATKLWKKTRKTYVVELPFIKTTLQILFTKWSQRKTCSKRTLCIDTSLKVCIPDIPTSTKTNSKKNIFWERSEIARKLAWKRSIKNLFY